MLIVEQTVQNMALYNRSHLTLVLNYLHVGLVLPKDTNEHLNL